MKATRTAVIGALASAAVIGSLAAGFAQSPSTPGNRVIEVPPGAVVLVLPAGSAADAAALPFPDMPSPFAMIRQMDQMMAEAQRAFAMPWTDQNRVTEAALPGAGPVSGVPVSGVMVTSFFNGHGTCTQRITYGGNLTAPKVEVSSTGDACASAGIPAVAPEVQVPSQSAPHLIQVRHQTAPHVIQARNHSHVAPLTYAQAGE